MEKSNDVNHIEKKLHRLEAKLKKHCIENNLEEIGSFTFMFNEEDGRNVKYVKDMEMAQIGREADFYDKNSPNYDHRYDNIQWPYTGFIQGVGEIPILIPDLVRWLEKSPYMKDSALGKSFIRYFEDVIEHRFSQYFLCQYE